MVGCSPAQDACPGYCDCTCTIYLNLVLTKGQFRPWSTYLRSSIYLSYAVLSDCNKLCQFHKHTNLDEDKLDCQDNKLWDLFLLSLRWYIKQNCYQELYMSICFVCSSLTPSNSCQGKAEIKYFPWLLFSAWRQWCDSSGISAIRVPPFLLNPESTQRYLDT